MDAYFDREAPYWREIYSADDLQSAIYNRRREAVLGFFDAMDLRPQSPVLECGCGAGLTTVAVASRGYPVTATDSVDAMLEMTRGVAQRSGLAGLVATRVADIHRLPFPNASFQAAVAIGVLPWLTSLEAPLREIARVVKPGGYVVTTVDNTLAFNRLLDPRLTPLIEPFKRGMRRIATRFGWRKPLPRARTHSIRQLDRALARAGFEKVDGQTVGFGPFTFCNKRLLSHQTGQRWNERLQQLATSGCPVFRSTGSHYVVLARKVIKGENHNA